MRGVALRALLAATVCAVMPLGGRVAAAPDFQSPPTSNLDPPPVVYSETGGRGRNVVVVNNQTNDRLRVRGSIQLNRIAGPGADPINRAEAWNVGTCTGCQGFSVALQINLVARTVAGAVAPENRALAAGDQCSACDADAWALQYRYPVDDPMQVPADANLLIRAMDRELRAVAAEPEMTLSKAKARIDAVIAQFPLPGAERDDVRDTHSRPAPTPPKNMAMVVNTVDGARRMRGAVQLNRITGAEASPDNLALSYAKCVECQVFTVALQINLARPAAAITPQNQGLAVNAECTRCRTVARALQYVFTVDDPQDVPPRVFALLRAMERQLQEIEATPDLSLADVDARVNAVIDEFKDLAQSLNDQRSENQGPAPLGEQPVAETGTEVDAA